MLDRSIWPTPARLKKLRDAGVIPERSPLIGYISVVFVILIVIPTFSGTLHKIGALSLSNTPDQMQIVFEELAKSLKESILLVFVVSMIAFIVVVGLNRGSISLSRLSPRIFSSDRFSRRITPSSFVFTVFKGLLSLSVLAASPYLVSLLCSVIIKPIIQPEGNLSKIFYELYYSATTKLALLALVFGAVFILVSNVSFRMQNMMSREELEQELRERDR